MSFLCIFRLLLLSIQLCCRHRSSWSWRGRSRWCCTRRSSTPRRATPSTSRPRTTTTFSTRRRARRNSRSSRYFKCWIKFWREFQIHIPNISVPVRRAPPHRQRIQPVGEAPADGAAAGSAAGVVVRGEGLSVE